MTQDPFAGIPRVNRSRSENPYCSCGKHLGMSFHESSEHDEAARILDKRMAAHPAGKKKTEMLVTSETVNVIAAWCGGQSVEEFEPFADVNAEPKRLPGVNVQTRDGVKRASDGDYVIKLSDGSFDVLKSGR